MFIRLTTGVSKLTGLQFQRISQNGIFSPSASSDPWEGLQSEIKQVQKLKAGKEFLKKHHEH